MSDFSSQIQFNNLPEKPENTKAWQLRLQRWMGQLDQQLGPPNDIMLIPTEDELPDVVVVVYHNWQQPERTLSLTFGVSECHEQVQGQYLPELALLVDSTNSKWSEYLGNLVAWMRTVEPFVIGATFDMSVPFAFPSLMDGFVLDSLDANLAKDLPKFKMLTLKLQYLQAIPIYRLEQHLLMKAGLNKFKAFPGFDPYNVLRPNIAESITQN
jgi:hypothetical protein